MDRVEITNTALIRPGDVMIVEGTEMVIDKIEGLGELNSKIFCGDFSEDMGKLGRFMYSGEIKVFGKPGPRSINPENDGK